jgi:long-chain acyl-CoA synthetase
MGRMTIVARLRERAERHADRPAIVEADRTTRYAELYDRVDRLSAALHALGLRKGDACLALLGNEAEAIECELAALQSGLAWVTLNARLTWAEVRGVVVTCQPRVIVCNGAGLETVRRGLETHGLEAVPTVIATGSGASAGSGTVAVPYAYEDLLAAQPPRRPDVVIGPEDVARLRYTSGTTGSAKAAVLPHRVYEAGLDNLIAELPPLSPEDRTLHVAPLTHGSGGLVYPMLWAGGQNVLLTRFDADEVLLAIEQHRITTLFTVPTILSRLLAARTFGARDLSSLRALIYGGAPMPEAQLLAAVARVGHALLHIYGMTEAPWPITTLKQAEHTLESPHLRSIGKPTTVCELRLVDAAGRVLGDGEIGEIQIRGRNVMSGYYQDEAATRAVLRDGWLSSGDLAVRDAEGYYTIVDRKKDVIISGGFNVYAKEVEMALCEHPAILEAAVVGLPHADYGELVAAWIVPAPGAVLTATEVDRFARGRLSGYKCPRRIEVVSDLPKNASGKILKRDIVRRLQGE